MRIPRIYIENSITPGDILALSKTASRHVSHVLRLTVGHPVILFNGQGGEYTGHIHVFEKGVTHIQIHTFSPREAESPFSLHLAQGLLRHEKMDFVIQKAVELGVKSITPLFTDRSSIKLGEDRIEKRMERWQNIIRSACEQCGRNQLPALHIPLSFSTWMQRPSSYFRILLHPQASNTLHALPSECAAVQLVVGPEGGLSAEEIAAAEKHGAWSARLGPRILRTETAPLAALSILQSLRGDL